jgi:hypothetical protein
MLQQMAGQVGRREPQLVLGVTLQPLQGLSSGYLGGFPAAQDQPQGQQQDEQSTPGA